MKNTVITNALNGTEKQIKLATDIISKPFECVMAYAECIRNDVCDKDEKADILEKAAAAYRAGIAKAFETNPNITNAGWVIEHDYMFERVMNQMFDQAISATPYKRYDFDHKLDLVFAGKIIIKSINN